MGPGGFEGSLDITEAKSATEAEGCDGFQDQSWMGDSSKRHTIKEVSGLYHLDKGAASSCNWLPSIGVTLETVRLLSGKCYELCHNGKATNSLGAACFVGPLGVSPGR